MSQETQGGQKKILSSAGAFLAAESLAFASEILRHPDKYGKESLRRLEVMQAIYEKYHEKIPNTWDLDEMNMPINEFSSGTWEDHCRDKLNDKEAGSLRVDVEKILSIISDFLDKRRENIGMLHDIHKGDIEEKFFSEIINWLIRCIDCDANDSLVERIDTRMNYLNAVMNDVEVFPKKHIHDKSTSFQIILEIHELLGKIKQKVKIIHDKKFILNKFQHISNTGELLIKHLLDGFSYFDKNLSTLKELNDQTISDVIKKSGTRYEHLFKLFLQNSFTGRFVLEKHLTQDIFYNISSSFNPTQFSTLMSNKTIKRGISVPMPAYIYETIVDIFMNAHQLCNVMALISHASMTLSEQGTVNLFCNEEGRLCYKFLISDFQSEMDSLLLKLENFNKLSMSYARNEYKNTWKKLHKNSPLGQYKRFQSKYNDMKIDCRKLKEQLDETAQKIEDFKGINPEGSLDKKKKLYEAIKKRMRLKNQHKLAEKLEEISEIYTTQKYSPTPLREEKMQELDNNEQIHSLIAMRSIHDEKISKETSEMNKISFCMQQIRLAIIRMENYRNANIITKFFRFGENDFNNAYLISLLKIFTQNKISFTNFYHELGDFLSKNNTKYADKEFYIVGSKLFFLLSQKKYRSIIFNETYLPQTPQKINTWKIYAEREQKIQARINHIVAETKKIDIKTYRLSSENMSLKIALSEKNKSLKETESKLNDEKLTVKTLNEENIALKAENFTLSDEINKLNKFVHTQKNEIKLLQDDRDAQQTRLTIQDEKISKQEGKLIDLALNMDNIIEKKIIALLEKANAEQKLDEPSNKKNSSAPNQEFPSEALHAHSAM